MQPRETSLGRFSRIALYARPNAEPRRILAALIFHVDHASTSERPRCASRFAPGRARLPVRNQRPFWRLRQRLWRRAPQAVAAHNHGFRLPSLILLLVILDTM